MSVSDGTRGAPGARPPLSDGDSRREEILEAALEVMSRRGFERTSIAAIAGRAGVARATVYQHFCDKLDILAALADRIARRIIEAVDGWAPLPIGPDAKPQELRAVIETRVGQILAAVAVNADATRLVVRLTRGSDRQYVHEMFRKIDEHVVAVLTREIATATRYRWARPCDPETAARFILGGLEKIASDAVDRETPLGPEIRAMAADIGRLVFFALAHPDLLARAPPA